MKSSGKLKKVGYARVYDIKTDHFRCRRLIYVNSINSNLYILQLKSKLEGWQLEYKKIDLEKYHLEFI